MIVETRVKLLPKQRKRSGLTGFGAYVPRYPRQAVIVTESSFRPVVDGRCD